MTKLRSIIKAFRIWLIERRGNVVMDEGEEHGPSAAFHEQFMREWRELRGAR